MLQQMVDIEPTFLNMCKAVFSDDKLSVESITSIIPGAEVFLCWWHLLYRDLDKTENLGRLAQCKDIQQFVKTHFVFGESEQSIEGKWQEFQKIFPERATQYMTYWMNKRQRWCRPWWAAFFTAMKTCNSMGESNNSILKVSYGFQTDTLVGVIQATHQRATQTRVEDLANADKNYITVKAATGLLQTLEPGSVDSQLAECRTLFAAHIHDRLKKSIQQTTHFNVLSETEHEVVVSKPRGPAFVVKKNPTTGLWECKVGCGKGTYKGSPCVHQLRTFQQKGSPYFQPLYIHTHWAVVTEYDHAALLQHYHDLRQEESGDDDYGVGFHEQNYDDDAEDHSVGNQKSPGSDSDCNDDVDCDDDTPGVGAGTAEPDTAPSGSLAPLQAAAQSAADPAQVKGITKRYAFAKTIFDNIAKNFSSTDLFVAVVEVLRAVDQTGNGPHAVTGLKRVRSYATADARLTTKLTQTSQGATGLLVAPAWKKQGRPTKKTRGYTTKEAKTGKGRTMCKFCRSIGHNATSTCPALNSRRMNQKLNCATLELVHTLPSERRDGSPDLDPNLKPKFVHVRARTADVVPACSNGTSSGRSSGKLFLCDLYEHSNMHLATAVVHLDDLVSWSNAPSVSVYITVLGAPTAAPAATPIFLNPRSDRGKVLQKVAIEVQRLREVWQRRVDTPMETPWEEDRIARITGTTAVHFKRNAVVPAHAIKKIFGLSVTPQTNQMKIGLALEKPVLDEFCRANGLTLNKNRAGLVLLAGSGYVGHSPDGVVSKPSREVLEVKVMFSSDGDEVDVDAVRKKHNDQMQLGLKVHKCSAGRLIVYPCQADMKLEDAKSHKVDKSKFIVLDFSSDRDWWKYFELNAHAFYSTHLEWFYGSEFDAQKAQSIVESLLNKKRKTGAN
jgi:hypothetical protein